MRASKSAQQAINFGSGWFPTLHPYREPASDAIARRLAAHARRRGGCWTAAELRALDVSAVARALEQDARSTASVTASSSWPATAAGTS